MGRGVFNIVMYSHDTYGLGHIRRTMAIARALVRHGVNILIITGSPVAGRFCLPRGVDFVRVPGMIKQSNTSYVPHAIKVEPEQAVAIRRNIILATICTFKPDLFIVDKVPTGLKGEILPALEWLRENKPQSRVVLGLRDIWDNAERTRKEWENKGFIEVLRRLYSEVWLYGEQELYDPIVEYAFPESLAQKTHFTGYIQRRSPAPKKKKKKHKHVLVTTGGGGDGYPVLDAFLGMLEQNGTVAFRTCMVAGPFLPKSLSESLRRRAKALGVRFSVFVKNIEEKMAEADLVVGMGGYNTVCEVLSQKKPSLIVPRDTPREEQLIRAHVFAQKGLVDYISWGDLAPQIMRKKVDCMLENPKPFYKAMDQFPLTGLDYMRERLAVFRRNY